MEKLNNRHPEPFGRHAEQSEASQGRLREGSMARDSSPAIESVAGSE